MACNPSAEKSGVNASSHTVHGLHVCVCVCVTSVSAATGMSQGGRTSTETEGEDAGKGGVIAWQ